jgi:enamine deaminase RidA (YjgF/YER057c/UK114 family)
VPFPNDVECFQTGPRANSVPRKGGLHQQTGEISSNITEEIAQAFRNVDTALTDAGGKGWSQVYRVNLYHTMPLDEEVHGAWVSNMQKWCPDHKPLFTVVNVASLALPGMHVEIEVVASL